MGSKMSIEELYERICNVPPTPLEVFNDALESCIVNEEFDRRQGPGNVSYRSGIMQAYDMVYSNDTSVLIASVGYKGHLTDITDVLRQMNDYKLDFPYYKHHKLYGCIAFFEITTEVRQAALAAGLIVFVKDKEDIVRVLNA